MPYTEPVWQDHCWQYGRLVVYHFNLQTTTRKLSTNHRYNFLDKKLPGTTVKVVVKKLLIDQFVFTPQLLVIFYVSKCFCTLKKVQ